VWEHFSENDDRLRSGKQLCKTSNAPSTVNGVPVPLGSLNIGPGGTGGLTANYFSQGCEATSLYAPSAFEVPNGFSLPYIIALAVGTDSSLNPTVDPYAGTTQSTNLRNIQSTIRPSYKAKNDTIEFNAVYTINPTLTLTSQTGYNQDYLWSTEDYNRFDTTPGIFNLPSLGAPFFFPDPAAGKNGISANAAVLCDPQLGCSDRIVAEDLNVEHAWQFSQEFRLASSFSGPFNFSVGGSYLHYETEENYYVFINALTGYSAQNGHDPDIVFNSADHSDCIQHHQEVGGWQNPDPALGGGEPTQVCIFIDTNPIGSLNNKGHNYFLSQNPYTLNSYAGFGEAYYNITDNLKLTGGLRWTVDQKRFTDIPSEVIARQSGYPVTGVVNQEWDRVTGRAVATWSPQLDFTDQSIFYASYAHGYKAGGANPPGAVFPEFGVGAVAFVDHPLTFKPEYIEALELGSKNTFLDGTLTLNADIFYYNYTGYQISEIVDRTAINNNYNAHVEGAEVESNWEPVPGLRFNFAGGWEQTGVAGGQSGIDLMDRTAGMPGWMVVKPFPTQASNCILPTYVVAAILQEQAGGAGFTEFACEQAYINHVDPATGLPYVSNPTISAPPQGFDVQPPTIPAGYPGFNPLNPAINNGEGFAKNLAGHRLTNAPPFTISFGTQYTMPVAEDWAATLRGDFYWQADSWARIFNDNPYDHLRGYTNVNLALILNSTDGWQVMGYVKNVFNTTAITGDFLNSDDSGLTTNVFLTDPRLFVISVNKDFTAGDRNEGFGVTEYLSELFSTDAKEEPNLWIELEGDAARIEGQGDPFAVPFLKLYPQSSVLKKPSPIQAQNPLPVSFDEQATLIFMPKESDWVFSAAVRFGRTGNKREVDHQTTGIFHPKYRSGLPYGPAYGVNKFSDTQVRNVESHATLDFMAGKDVGLGMLGLDGASSVLSGGIRFAQFNSSASLNLRARPDLVFRTVPSAAAPTHFRLDSFHTYHVTGEATRKFRGVGPSISWTGSMPVEGNLQDGELTLDWGANGALLFGRQKAHAQHHESANYGLFIAQYVSLYDRTASRSAVRSVTVPNLGGLAGVSYRFNNAKVSIGYRGDFFFGAIDGGIDARKSETLGFFGPFAKISIGIGG
jgi:outer membrane receptor protein involved in Fe transport